MTVRDHDAMPMRPLSEMPASVAAGIHTLFSDIDDTLTTEGRLTVEAYAALAALRDALVDEHAVLGIVDRASDGQDLVDLDVAHFGHFR